MHPHRPPRRLKRLQPRPMRPIPGDLIVHGWSRLDDSTVDAAGAHAEPTPTTWVQGEIVTRGCWATYRK